VFVITTSSTSDSGHGGKVRVVGFSLSMTRDYFSIIFSITIVGIPAAGSHVFRLS
jgi:hypothetical protein